MTEHALPFQYSPLSGLRSIRILILQPAWKVSHPIQCSFKETSLEEQGTALPYEALSYTWGAPRGTKAILCEGRTILVTPNCEQALLHLRLRSRPRTLWIDAICIDQRSIQEKNQQVPIMGEIYRHASRTILWLGQDTDTEHSIALRRAARYGNWINGIKRAYRKVREDTGDRAHEGYWQAPVLSVAESERIADLCRNEWFGRMWTIQEFLLSKSAVFMMGNVTCPSPALFTYYCLGKTLVLRPDLEHFRMRNSLITLMPYSSINKSVSKSFLVSIVKLATLNNATDARDKVYGMIAYLESRWPDFQPPLVDYAQSIADTYESFTRSLITATSSLWPLELVNGSSGPESDALPSWVLDLRDPDRLAPGWIPSFTRSGVQMNKYIPVQLEKPGQLSVRAKRIGKVVRTSSRMPFWDSKSKRISAEEMDLARSTCLSEWTAFATDLDMHEDQANSPYLYHASSRDYHRKNKFHWDHAEAQCSDPNTHALEELSTQLDYLRFRHQAEDEVSIDSWPAFGRDREQVEKKKMKRRREKWKARRKEAEGDSSYYNQDSSAHDMCRLFLMSTGHLGESPGDVCVGDSIFVIQGSGFPFVLRGRGKQFLIVGKADIHRTRDDAWDASKLDQDEEARNIVLV